MNKYTVRCHRVIDGDTFVGDLHIDPFHIVLKDQHFRLLGVNTPERGEPLYKEARDMAAVLIEKKVVTVTVHDKDAFGRWLVDTTVYGRDETLNEILLEEGLAVGYKN